MLHEFSSNNQFHSPYELWNDTIPASDKLGLFQITLEYNYFNSF